MGPAEFHGWLHHCPRTGGVVGSCHFPGDGIYHILAATRRTGYSRPLGFIRCLVRIYTAIGIVPQVISDNINPLSNLFIAVLIISTFTILAPPALIRFALVFPNPSQPCCDIHGLPICPMAWARSALARSCCNSSFLAMSGQAFRY